MIVYRPIISEKASKLSETKGQYVFEVHPKANKLQIKEAVEQIYGVSVVRVNTAIYRPDVKSRYTKSGLQVGKTNRSKRAFVHLAEGDEIELF